MVINAIIQPVQVRVGGQDLTEYLVEASVYRSGVVFGGILHWHCDLTFNVKPTGPIELDDRFNSALKRGQLIEITYAGLTRRLRVDKAFFDPVKLQLKVSGIDILQLFSYRSPAESDLNEYTSQISLECGQVPESIEFKTVSWTIAQLLSYAGIPSSQVVAPPIYELVNFYLDKDSNQSYIEMAAEIAASFLYWMEVTPDERVVFHRFYEPAASIVYRYNHLLDFRRIEPLMEDPEIICVTGIRKRIVLPKQQYVFSSEKRDIADNEVEGTRRIENSSSWARFNYNPCNRYGWISFRDINWPSFSVRPQNGRGSYIREVLDITTYGLWGRPDYEEEVDTDGRVFGSPDPPRGTGRDGEAFRWTSSLWTTGRSSGKKVTQKFYRWNRDNRLEATFEVVVSWDQYLEYTIAGHTKQASIKVNGEAVFTKYIYDAEKGNLKQVQIYSTRGVADISELHEDEENPKAYKTKSRVEKERVANIVDYLDANTAAIKRTSVEGERFLREVVYEGEEGLPREEGDEYVTISERQASSDTYFEYIDGLPGGENRPPLTSEEEEVIEAEYARAVNIAYLPRKKEIKINWAFSRGQLLEIAAWFSRYYVYKQHEYEAAVALEPRLWELQGFVGCLALGIYGIIDSISFAWTSDGRSECSFRLLGYGHSRLELPSFPYEQYQVPEYPPFNETRKLEVQPIPNYEFLVGESVSIGVVLYYGVGPFQIVVSGLPSGLSFSEANRRIVGVAAVVGTYSVSVTVVDLGDGGYSVVRSFSLVIRSLPSSIPLVIPENKLEMASGGQVMLSFLNYARSSWQVERVYVVAGAAMEIRSRMNVFGLASGQAWHVEVRLTARGVAFASGSAGRLSFVRTRFNWSSGSSLRLQGAQNVRLASGQQMRLVGGWNILAAAAGSVSYLAVADRVWYLSAGQNLDFEQAQIVAFVSGSTMRLFGRMTEIRNVGGSVFRVDTEGAEAFNVLMAQSMNIEVGYIEQQVYD